MKDGIDLTISNRMPYKNCTSSFPTLIDLIALYSFSSSSSNDSIVIQLEDINNLKLIHLCISVDIRSIEKLENIRRLSFENCSIHFTSSENTEDYDSYPKNLSYWSFNHGQTDTFNRFVTMVNHLGPFKFDLHISSCFQPVLSFNDFIPLESPMICLNISCEEFQIDEPHSTKTLSAIFLTPTIIINTHLSPCPSVTKYLWLNSKRVRTKIHLLRALDLKTRHLCVIKTLYTYEIQAQQQRYTAAADWLTKPVSPIRTEHQVEYIRNDTISRGHFIEHLHIDYICKADDIDDDTVSTSTLPPKVDNDIGKHSDASKTDDEVVQKEEEAIKLDGLSAKEFRTLVDASEKHQFQTEVNRMMKLIINSLYKNKEIFLRELISNASDALDKIRFLSLTDKSVLGDKEELTIRIKIDKESRMLHITDTGIGMTKADLVQFLGTIAKSDTSEFLSKVQDAQKEAKDGASMSDLIGQFGVGFYSSFLVADKVIVTSKNNADEQHIWESDSTSFNVVKDPRGNTLGRGTTVSLHLKEEAGEYLEIHTLEEIIRKYSQFINFNIYLWKSKTVKEEVPDDDATTDDKKTDEADKKADDDAAVEDDKEEEKKAKTKTVDKTVWDWELMNESKPIWQRKPAEVTEDEYNAFYKSFTKESEPPMIYSHFTAEGEVTFKSILYVPKAAPF
ncbi:unnamed protein product, partial [Adineta ricciae]